MSESDEREELVKAAMPVLLAMRLYHRHEVVGLEHIPAEGPALVVINHSLATYDIALLMAVIYTELHRIPRSLADRLFFKIPYIGEAIQLFGVVQGSREAAKGLLEAGEIVSVAPGGMREALRPSSQRYQILWEKRFGFVRLAMAAKAPIILAACPKADDLYDVYPSHVTSWFYRNFKVPVFLARGLGPTPVPRPVKLVHFLSEPIAPPAVPADPEEEEKVVRKFHARLVKRMKELIGEGIHYQA